MDPKPKKNSVEVLIVSLKGHFFFIFFAFLDFFSFLLLNFVFSYGKEKIN